MSRFDLSRVARRAGFVLGLAALLSACGGEPANVLDEVRRLQEAGSHQEAEEILREHLAANPDDAEASFRLGVSLISLGRGSEAVFPLRKATESDEFGKQANLVLAGTLLNTRNYTAAIEAADAVLAKEPENETALVTRVRAAIGALKSDAALSSVDALEKLRPGELMPAVLRAEALGIDAARIAEAEKIYSELEARDWGDDALGPGRACLSRAKLVLERGSDAARAGETVLGCAAKYAEQPALLLGAATLLDRQGRGPEATKLVREAFSKNPESLELRAGLADRLVAEDQFSEAEKIVVEEAEKQNTAGPWAALAHLRRRLRNFDGALDAQDKAIAVAPPELLEEMHADRADLLLDMGRLDDAEAELDEIDSAVFRNLIEGRLFEERGNGAEALAKYSAALEQWPDNWAVRVRAAQLAFNAGDLDRALAELREVTRAAPKDTDAALHMAQIYLSRGKLQEAHAFAMRHVNERGATGPEGHLVASRAAGAAKRWEEVSRVLEDLAGRHDGKFRAIAFAEHARLTAGEQGPAAALSALEAAAAKAKLDLDAPEGAPALQQAVALISEARGAEAALARIDAALAKSPARTDLIALRANQLATAGRFDEARAAADQALAANADEALAHVALGVAKRGQGDSRGAVTSFDRAIALDPGLSTAGYLAATTLIAAGDAAAGRERLEKLVRAYPDQAAALNDLAWMLAEAGSDLERAGEFASRATRLDGRAEMFDTFGYVRLKQERFEEAARAFRLSLEKNENYSTARYHLALALERGGDAAAAQQELKLAVAGSAFPELDAAKSALARLERGAAGGAQ